MKPQIVTGMILGKFLPLHKGHEYLINTASQKVDKLYIVVDNISNEVIKVQTRMDWIKKTYPDAAVLTLNKELPQYPGKNPDNFWEIWQKELKKILPEAINYVFASEEYGKKLADILNAKFHMVDLKRKNIPICATKIRNNPYQYWEYLSNEAKPFYCKKICIFGPESVGKSTLTRKLARHYNTNFVPEYAREVIEKNNGNINYDHIKEIALGHNQTIKSKIKFADKLLFVDTDAITTKIWSQELFGKYPKLLDKIIDETKYSLYLLLDVDVPWIQDVARYRPDNRNIFFSKCENELKAYNKKYIKITGSWDERFNKAVKAIDNVLVNFISQINS